MRFLALLCLSLVLAAPASAGAAERRPAIVSPYLDGLDLHTPDGGVLHVDLAERRATETWLLGETDRGWVVGAGCGYFLVTADATTRIWKRDCDGIDFTELLSDDGRHIVRSQRDLTQVTVRASDLDGHVSPAATITHARSPVVSDADAGTAYVASYAGVFEVDLVSGEVEHTLTSKSNHLDLETDTLFVKSPKGYENFGPTALSDPGPPGWVRFFQASDVSPSGKYVLGELQGHGRYVFTVLRVGDGSRVRNLPFPGGSAYDAYFYDVVGWDSDRAVVMVKHIGKRRAIVRCPVPKGRCARVTPLTSNMLSLPTETVGPHRYDVLD